MHTVQPSLLCLYIHVMLIYNSEVLAINQSPHCFCFSNKDMSTFKLSSLSLTLIVLIAFSAWSSSLLEPCEARKGKHHQWRQNRGSASLRGKKGYGGGRHHPSGHTVSAFLSDSYITSEDTAVSAAQKNSAVYNVLDYGAKGDGKADDTKVIDS